jgi:hypothetical protein
MVKKFYVAADNYGATGTLAQVPEARSIHCAFPMGKTVLVLKVYRAIGKSFQICSYRLCL